MKRLAEVLKIRPGEERMASLMIGLMLFASAGYTVGNTGVEALFFARYGVQFLPYMYMALGLLIVFHYTGYYCPARPSSSRNALRGVAGRCGRGTGWWLGIPFHQIGNYLPDLVAWDGNR